MCNGLRCLELLGMSLFDSHSCVRPLERQVLLLTSDLRKPKINPANTSMCVWYAVTDSCYTFLGTFVQIYVSPYTRHLPSPLLPHPPPVTLSWPQTCSTPSCSTTAVSDIKGPFKMAVLDLIQSRLLQGTASGLLLGVQNGQHRA